MRFEAMREINPAIVTLRGEADARDIDNNPVALDEVAIAVVVARMTQEALDAQAIADAKEAKKEALANITVITTNGNTFDADDVGRASMNEAIASADFLGLTENNWKLADNTVALIGLDELKEALALGIQAKGAIILGV